jgi:hypothetical protein
MGLLNFKSMLMLVGRSVGWPRDARKSAEFGERKTYWETQKGNVVSRPDLLPFFGLWVTLWNRDGSQCT